MSQSRILLVEDEEHLLEAIKLNLELEGYHVTTAMDGKKALRLIKEERFNLVLLDVMLPEIDGFQVAETIRLQNYDVPILFLTAKNTSEDRVMGLKKGADDYLTKPFNLEELILRVGILVKRSLRNTEEGKSLNTYKIGDKEINFTSFELTTDDGITTMLTKKEVMLLKLLIERKGEVVSREQILETVWNYDVFPSTRTIDNFILSFRKYFEPNPKEPRYFHSIRGVGYKFTD
ncbi:response regulator transcription factor [Solitalea sp. MAHUQ-68]|uniref:Response regulator transcription factor n=1 Tax=Solitalea agri TaxID=2953739 RepID=A0A9X2F0Q2_9SPHI|nr:response regulator transcription factor [Solitalea agri]MCO4292482.1 response regulator transcription factor [Solitalea agri]